MNKKIIRIPEGIFFLGNYTGLCTQFPQNSFILNKVMTGCGATTMFLNDDVPTILCSPRREMLHCKANSPEFRGKLHLFGSGVQGDVVPGKICDMKNYIMSTIPVPSSFPAMKSTMIPKILTTYDSAKYVIQGLREMGFLKFFRIVVDEFHTIFTDAAFRGDTEAEFMANIGKVPTQIVYLSATPFMEKYLDLLPEFSSLPYIELEWPESSKHLTSIVVSRYYRGSRTQTIRRLIDNYKSRGYFEQKIDENGVKVQAKEAVFFINDPEFIKKTVVSNGLDPNDVNVICAMGQKNENILSKAGLTIGHAPICGQPHKTYTFVTKCAFEGTDFYSTNAYTYIFSDINPELKNMAIDISVDLPQIMGRQRLAQNAFRYNATLFCKTIPKFSEEDEKAFQERIKMKSDTTECVINDFYMRTDGRLRTIYASKFRNSQQQENYKNDYITVIDDKVSNQLQVVFNKYVMLNEIRAWEVQRDQYINGTYVMNSINDAFASSTSQSSIKVNEFLQNFSGTFEERMRMYSEFIDKNPECRNEIQGCVQIPTPMKEYYNSLGSEKLRSLSWKESNIKNCLIIGNQTGNLAEYIKSVFPDDWYSLKEIKQKLQNVYNQYMPGKIAKASDLMNFLECTPKKMLVSDKRENGFQIIR